MPPTQDDDARARHGRRASQLALHLQGEFAGGRDDQGQRLAGVSKRSAVAEQGRGDGEAVGDRLAGAGLGGDEKIPLLASGCSTAAWTGVGSR